MLKFLISLLKKRLIKLNLKKFKSLSIFVFLGGSGIKTKSRQFNLTKALLIVGVYSLVFFFMGFIVLNLTPVRGLVFPASSNLNHAEKKLLNDLNQRLIFLTFELEKLKSTNQQLKDAILLGDSTLIDSLNKANSSEIKKESPYGGSILFVFQQLLLQEREQQAVIIHFSKPVNGFISRGFNPDNGHMGVDFVIKTGTPVFSAAAGYVIFADYTVNDGYMIIIAHSDGYITVYKHCSALLKKTRDIVSEGEIIALSGNTGELSTGPHLHFEIWKNGKPIDPQNLFINN
jgi:murein DD-endopeptidase MepM/ murein hydrolase activator NlpD